MVLKSASKVAENASKRKSLEIREEISSLVNSLMELEYKSKDEGAKTRKPQYLPTEEEFLGLHSKVNFQLPTKRLETQRFLDSIDDEISSSLFASDDFLEARKWNPTKSQQDPGTETSCKCLSEFYDQHSACQ